MHLKHTGYLSRECYDLQVRKLSKTFKKISHPSNLGNLRAISTHAMSELFDPEWYAHNYLGHVDKRYLAWEHYLTEGAKAGCDPCIYFDTDWYLFNNPDVTASEINPLLHFDQHGWQERRNPNPMFDISEYLEANSDVHESGKNPLLHYIQFGFMEGRVPFKNSWPTDVNPWMQSCIYKPRRSTNQADKSVALLIPVHNNWYLTDRCIQSIFRTADASKVDIFIINDGSDDDTLKQLENYPSVRIINTPQNLGFTNACNFAFGKTGHYDYTYLLNNDTEVQNGFIQHCLEVMRINPLVALVGSTFHYPFGTIQECGGIVWKDGSAWNFGRGQNANSLEFSFSRQVDYCSGAGILINNKALSAVNFFDEIYAPAYYEDVDLAFKMRDKGYEVWVSSNSRVIHYEGGSHGTDLDNGIKAFQKINQGKFSAKWKSDLTSHIENDGASSLKAAMRLMDFGDEAVIWVDDSVPDIQTDSGSVRALRLIENTLGLGFTVVFVSVHQSFGSSHRKLSTDLKAFATDSFSSAVNFLEELDIPVAYLWLTRVTSAREVISGAIICSPRSKIIFDTVDLHHLRILRSGEHQKSDTQIALAGKIKAQEELLIRFSDVTFVVSDFEKNLYSRTEFRHKVKVLSNIHNATSAPPHFEDTRGIFFIGGFRHHPNVEGIKWFVQKVWPLIPLEVRKYGLTIAGSHMPKEIIELKSREINTLGWVSDSIAETRKHRISVAPLLFGAGVKGKVGEAMSEGIPVIGTPIAMEGMGVIDGINAIVCETPLQFAESIADLYRDELLWGRIQQEALDLIRNRFSNEVARETLKSVLKKSKKS